MGAPKTSENEKPPNSNSTTSNPEEAFNADIILTQLGPIGWFQLKYLVGVGYSLLFTTAAILIYSFVGGVPAHRYWNLNRLKYLERLIYINRMSEVGVSSRDVMIRTFWNTKQTGSQRVVQFLLISRPLLEVGVVVMSLTLHRVPLTTLSVILAAVGFLIHLFLQELLSLT